MNNASCRGLVRKQLLRFRKEAWEHIDDVVSDERRLTVFWQDSLNNDCGQTVLWSWPHDLAPLALGHVLLDIRPQGGTLVRHCSVSQKAEDAYSVTLGALQEQKRQSSLSNITGSTLFQAMHSFIKAQSQWDGTGCFHQAGVFDPATSRFLARAEDIGRHNCLDRLAGWSAINSVPLEDCILFTSARITASLCAKALRAGFSILVSRSAVTTAAIALAEEHKVSLIGFARTDEERLTLFADPLGRIAVDSHRN